MPLGLPMLTIAYIYYSFENILILLRDKQFSAESPTNGTQSVS